MGRTSRSWRFVLGLALATTACGGNSATAFAPGLQPLEVSTAARPALVMGRCPEAANTTRGDRGEYEFAHLRGCIQAPLARVWEAMQDPAVTVDRRRVSSFTTQSNVEQGYPVSFRVFNVVNDIVTIRFELTWRAGAIEGTAEQPTAVSARYQKTEGSNFITTLAGSIVARTLDASTTEIEIVRHIHSTGAGAAEAEIYLNDCFASLVARTHGRALPSYN